MCPALEIASGQSGKPVACTRARVVGAVEVVVWVVLQTDVVLIIGLEKTGIVNG